jgi:hypothetical protein
MAGMVTMERERIKAWIFIVLFREMKRSGRPLGFRKLEARAHIATSSPEILKPDPSPGPGGAGVDLDGPVIPVVAVNDRVGRDRREQKAG